MKGTVYKGEITRWQDPDTGVEVTRITDNLANSYHPYFTQQLVDKENRSVLIMSDVSGSLQLHMVSFADGKMLQLTDDASFNPHGACLDAENGIAYFVAGREIKGVRLDNLKTETVFELPEGFRSTALSCTNDGRYLAFAYTEVLKLSTQTGIIYSGMREQQFRRPRSVLMRFDAQEKKPYVAWGETEWISHVMINPIDPNIILFCHEGQWHSVQRLWISNVKTDQVYPLIDQKLNYERAGHEFFLADGRIAAQYSLRHNLDTDFNESLMGDIFIRPDGTEKQIYLYPFKRASHFQMNSRMDTGVADAAHIKKDMADGYAYMSLTKYSGNYVQVGLLCKHGTSWLTQDSHPHPIFTRDDRHVIFSSDFGGKRNVYMAEAVWEKCIKGPSL